MDEKEKYINGTKGRQLIVEGKSGKKLKTLQKKQKRGGGEGKCGEKISALRQGLSAASQATRNLRNNGTDAFPAFMRYAFSCSTRPISM